MKRSTYVWGIIALTILRLPAAHDAGREASAVAWNPPNVVWKAPGVVGKPSPAVPAISALPEASTAMPPIRAIPPPRWVE